MYVRKESNQPISRPYHMTRIKVLSRSVMESGETRPSQSVATSPYGEMAEGPISRCNRRNKLLQGKSGFSPSLLPLRLLSHVLNASRRDPRIHPLGLSFHSSLRFA